MVPCCRTALQNLVVGVYQCVVVADQPHENPCPARVPSGSVLGRRAPAGFPRGFPATSGAADRSLSLLSPRSRRTRDQSRRRYRGTRPICSRCVRHAGFGRSTFVMSQRSAGTTSDQIVSSRGNASCPGCRCPRQPALACVAWLASRSLFSPYPQFKLLPAAYRRTSVGLKTAA